MIYVTSDLHGCPPGQLRRLLNDAGFTQEDFLFVLGDVIDRGEHGVKLLLWLAEQPNAQLILGNHEALILACDFLFDEVTEENLEKLTVEQMRMLELWLANGGSPTLADLRNLLKRDEALFFGLLDYLREAPLYECVEAGGREYILVHAGLGNFAPERPLSGYTAEELLLHRPTPQERYFDTAHVILGHTPTELFGEEHRGRAFHTPTWTCIDTGAASGNRPMLLRLDDMREFY